MNLRANIEHLAAAQGIVAVTVYSPPAPRELRGEPHWGPILDASLSLLEKTGEKTIRIVVGAHTLVLQVEGAETVGVVIPTGDPIAKSLRRMIRRLARKPRLSAAAPSRWVPPGASPPDTPSPIAEEMEARRG